MSSLFLLQLEWTMGLSRGSDLVVSGLRRSALARGKQRGASSLSNCRKSPKASAFQYACTFSLLVVVSLANLTILEDGDF